MRKDVMFIRRLLTREDAYKLEVEVNRELAEGYVVVGSSVDGELVIIHLAPPEADGITPAGAE